jgi:hypothetical protein
MAFIVLAGVWKCLDIPRRLKDGVGSGATQTY